MERGVTFEELQAAVSYIEEFQKSNTDTPLTGPAPGFDMSSDTNGERKEFQKAKRKEAMTYHAEMAKAHKEAIDKMEKGEDVEDVEEEEEEFVEKCKLKKSLTPVPGKAAGSGLIPKPGKAATEGESSSGNLAGEKDINPEVPNGLSGLTRGDKTSTEVKRDRTLDPGLVKSIISEALTPLTQAYDTILKSKDEEIGSLRNEFESRLKSLEDYPVQKSIRKGANSVVLQKSLTGERDEDGVKYLSNSLHKSTISNVLFNAWESCNEPIMKGKLEGAVYAYEASGNEISNDVQQYLLKSEGIQVIK